VVMLGNSHVRNLFRCAADVASMGASAQDKGTCGEAADQKACLACANLAPVHSRDFRYYDSDLRLRLEFDWLTVWDVPEEARSACKGQPKAARQPCMLRMSPNLANWSYYYGHRVGVDYLEHEVFPRMRADPRTFVVLSASTLLSPPSVARSLTKLISRYPALRPRIIFVAGGVPAQGNRSVDEEVLLETVRNASVEILNVAPLLPSYQADLKRHRLQADWEGPARSWIHIGPSLQRVLLRQVFTRIAIARWESGEFPDPPTPMLCRTGDKLLRAHRRFGIKSPYR